MASAAELLYAGGALSLALRAPALAFTLLGLSLGLVVLSFVARAARRRASSLRARQERGSIMRKLLMVLPVIVLGALIFAFPAFAVTVPAVPVSTYGSALLTALADGIADIFPYAAAITAFAIAVGMVKRWLGHRSAARG